MTEEIKKINKRGVGSARGTIRLKFDTRDAQPNGLFLAHLNNVVVSKINISEESTGMPSFNGMEIPKLTLTFASNEPEIAKRKYITMSFNAVESNVKTIPGGGEDWKVNQVLDYIKHILDVFVLQGKRELTDEEVAALSLDYEDFDQDGLYVSVEPEVVVNAWDNLFNNFVNILNTCRDGEPCYTTKDNKPVSLWIKLIRYNKTKKKGWVAINDGNLAFTSFVGEGSIELFKTNTAPVLKINKVNERVSVMDIKEQPKTPNMPGVPMMGGNIIPTDMSITANTLDAIPVLGDDDEMPF